VVQVGILSKTLPISQSLSKRMPEIRKVGTREITIR